MAKKFVKKGQTLKFPQMLIIFSVRSYIYFLANVQVSKILPKMAEGKRKNLLFSPHLYFAQRG